MLAKWSVVGSPNLTSRSRRLDDENAFGLLDRELGQRLVEIFLSDRQRSDEIDPAGGAGEGRCCGFCSARRSCWTSSRAR